MSSGEGLGRSEVAQAVTAAPAWRARAKCAAVFVVLGPIVGLFAFPAIVMKSLDGVLIGLFILPLSLPIAFLVGGPVAALTALLSLTIPRRLPWWAHLYVVTLGGAIFAAVAAPSSHRTSLEPYLQMGVAGAFAAWVCMLFTLSRLRVGIVDAQANEPSKSAARVAITALPLIAMSLIVLEIQDEPRTCRALPARIDLGGSAWRLPADSAPLIHDGQRRRFLLRHKNGQKLLCGPREPVSNPLDGFTLHSSTLRKLAQDDLRIQGLSDFQELQIGGPLRQSALPRPGRNETFGPSLFGRPTILKCTPRREPLGDPGVNCLLWGWAPGGVPLQLSYKAEPGVEPRFKAVEAFISGLRLGKNDAP